MRISPLPSWSVTGWLCASVLYLSLVPAAFGQDYQAAQQAARRAAEQAARDRLNAANAQAELQRIRDGQERQRREAQQAPATNMSPGKYEARTRDSSGSAAVSLPAPHSINSPAAPAILQPVQPPSLSPAERYARGQRALDGGRPEHAAIDFLEAARQGHAGAQYRVGLLYETGGDGVARDPTEALQWYRKSASQGNLMAQSALDRFRP